MERIRRTWSLAKTSWAVLRQDRELLVLPIISFVASLIAAATFLVPIFASGSLDSGQMGAPEYAILLAMYFVLSFITIYFQTALVCAAHERLSGGDPTLSSALGGANKHLPQILAWSALTATVSLILRAIEERAGFVGRIIAGIIGFAWTTATFLVVPTYVVENVGPVTAVKRSGALLKQTWGENLASQVGFGLLGFLAAIPGVALIAVGFTIGGPALVAGLLIGALWIAAVAVTLTAMTAIFQTALFHHAVGQPLAVGGAGFDQPTLQAAFRRK